MNTSKMVRISDFCTTGSGGTPARQNARYYRNGTIPWVKSGELREDIINNAEEFITFDALKETSVKMVPKNSLLLAMYGATVGRLAILGIPATTNQAICHIIPNAKVAEVRYLFHALRAQVEYIISQGVGGAQPNINQSIVKNLEVRLPSLEEQRRTIELLDKSEDLKVKRINAIGKINLLI
ncbi:MAG: restriction endonuclease subunit S, partial [Bdellovibrionaceae bacterium]|nr:restriction endonuclease subunit S [Pseudobdellovibrionaceae bacterium]